MGRCYMEFTTFKVFTKQENPFKGLLRNKRNAAVFEGPITRFDEDIGYTDYVSDDENKLLAAQSAKAAEKESIKVCF